MIILFALLAFVATFCGGLFALKYHDKLHLVLGFSAGALLGVAFFDLIPESIELASSAYSLQTTLTVTAVGFTVYMLANRWFMVCSHDDEHCENVSHKGILGASSLALHSFLDGAAIGLGFQVSTLVGAVVTAAVLVHDFSDGINTVGLVLRNKGSRSQAFRWLVTDALAPIAGAVSTMFFTLPEASLGIILALFAGFFLYLGASDLLPESHHHHPTWGTTLLTLVGMGLIYFVIRLVGA